MMQEPVHSEEEFISLLRRHDILTHTFDPNVADFILERLPENMKSVVFFGSNHFVDMSAHGIETLGSRLAKRRKTLTLHFSPWDPATEEVWLDTNRLLGYADYIPQATLYVGDAAKSAGMELTIHDEQIKSEFLRFMAMGSSDGPGPRLRLVHSRASSDDQRSMGGGKIAGTRLFTPSM